MSDAKNSLFQRFLPIDLESSSGKTCGSKVKAVLIIENRRYLIMMHHSRRNPMKNLTYSIMAVSIAALFLLSALSMYSLSPASASDPCTTTYLPGSYVSFTPISISSSGTYCFEAGTYNTQITVTASNVVLTTAPGTKLGQAIIEPSSIASLTTYTPTYPSGCIVAP